MKNVQLLVKKTLELLSEIEAYSFHKENMVKTLDKLFRDYQAGKFTYFEYEKTVKKLLKGKTKDEWISYYNSYILSLLKRVEAYNTQIFYETYHNTDYVNVKVVKPVPKPAPKPAPKTKPAHLQKPAPKHVPKPAKHVPPVHKHVPEHVPDQVPEQVPEPASHVPEPVVEAGPAPAAAPPAPDDVHLVEVKPSIIDRISLFFRHIFAKKEVAEARKDFHPKPVKVVEKEPTPATKPAAAEKPAAKKEKEPWFAFLWKHDKKTLPLEEPGVPVEKPKAKHKPKTAPSKAPAKAGKYTWWDWFIGKPKPASHIGAKTGKLDEPKKKGKGAVAFAEFMGIKYITNLLERSRKVEFSDESSKAPMSTIQLETLRRKAKPEISAQIEKITATSLTKEAKRIKSIMEKRKALKIYQPSFFGAVANVAIKKVSLFLLDQFPDFFKDLYHALRLANIKVLSNTYVNMLVLGVFVSTILGFFLFGFFFSVSALPISQILFRTLMMSLLSGLAAFGGFYAYPYSKVKQRRTSINTNLPFAINHMAAVSSSGVAPVRMFKLISESKEYGEVSAEIEKIVNYVEVFGYDVLTAIKSVAATTPSYQFKDFLEGMVSTTQTGGDLKSYFSQKAEEAMVHYKMERQKYTETIATYSDIYTGLLIAAPLFFVAALSLVSLLGGKVGGMDVNIVIVLGTYVVIPFMNVSFLTFLELTQPEV